MARYACENEEALLRVAQKFAKSIKPPVVMHFYGDLGAGKTSFVRGLLHALGYQGLVKSPTYTIVEYYTVGNLNIYHYDLYRIADPEELEYIGIRDILNEEAIVLIEWPAKGEGFIPPADIVCEIEFAGKGRVVTLR